MSSKLIFNRNLLKHHRQRLDQLWAKKARKPTMINCGQRYFNRKEKINWSFIRKRSKKFKKCWKKTCEFGPQTQRPSKLVLISGPSGSGKSTCLRILAETLKIHIVEWETRTTTNLTSSVLDEERDDRQSIESQKRSFRTFLFQSTRYLSSSMGQNSGDGLFFENNSNDDDDDDDQNENEEKPKKISSPIYKHQLVLIEDLPNAFYSDVELFHSTLRELKRVAHHPVVFVLTDNSSLSAAQNPHLLFPLSILDELKIEQIHFNGFAATFMKKALDAIITEASHLKLKPPSRDRIDQIVQIANGDLRLAINTLQFSSNDKTKLKGGSLSSKDSCISLFQGLGRILYKKNAEEDPNDVTKSYPENLIEQCHVSTPTFIGFLFENYLDFYSLMEDTERLCDYLSIGDYIVHEWETRLQLLSICSSITCRAVRSCNSMPNQPGFKPMRKPQDQEIRTRAQKSRTLLNTNKLYYGCSENEYFMTILPYQGYLLKSTRSSLNNNNVTNKTILDVAFIDRHSRKRHDVNSMLTMKNNTMALLTDDRDDQSSNEPSFNFSLIQATTKTNRWNQFEYDDQIDIETIDD